MKRMLRQACLLGLAVILTSTAALSQSFDTKSVKRLAELNSEIARLSESRLSGREASKFENAAKERREILSRMIESAPADALRYGLSSDELAKVPARNAGLFEKHVELTGELEVIAECEEHNSKTERFVKTNDGKFEVFFQNSPDEQSGSTISLSGISIDGKVAVESFAAQAQALPNTTGEKKVLVILVNFQDKQTQPFTAEHARSVMFDTASSYYYENSYGQTWLTGDVSGWFTIPLNSTSCNTAAIASYAEQAAASAGVNLSAYQHKIYGVPRIAACGFAGSGSVGGNPSQAWINSDRFGFEVVGHEFGHNLGLWHSRSLDCGTDVLGSNCTSSEYGDSFDLMGAAIPAHVNLFQKERLGWVNAGSSPSINAVVSSGTYRIEPLAIAGTSPKGLKVLRSTDPSTGQRTWFYLEHRTPSGFDSSLAYYNVQNGVVVHSGSEASGSDIYLLDMTPATADWTDSFLAVGASFTDPTAGVTITTVSADGNGAWVRVEMGAQPQPTPTPTPTPTPIPTPTPTPSCIRANPTVSVSPGQSVWMLPGSAFTYQVTVRNNNSGGCANESFNLGASVPGGFSASYSNASLSLANGASGTANLSVASGSSSTDGTYSLGVGAANSASPNYSGSASASYVLVSQLGITATPGASTYTRTQTATVASIVSAGGAPRANVPVTFTMIRPGGKTVNQTVNTGSDGRAVFSYRFSKKNDSMGTYQVQASASFNGLSGQASTSFVVNR